MSSGLAEQTLVNKSCLVVIAQFIHFVACLAITFVVPVTDGTDAPAYHRSMQKDCWLADFCVPLLQASTGCSKHLEADVPTDHALCLTWS